MQKQKGYKFSYSACLDEHLEKHKNICPCKSRNLIRLNEWFIDIREKILILKNSGIINLIKCVTFAI